MFSLIMIFFIIIIWILVDRWKNRSLVSLSKILKTDLTRIPIIGHAYLFIGNSKNKMKFIETIGRDAIKHDGVSSVWVGNRMYVVVADPQIAEFIAKNFLEKDDKIMQISRHFLGNSTIYAPVSIWRPRRKILAPTFSPKNLNNFVNVFAKQCAMMAEQLQPLAGTGPLAFGKYLPQYTMRSVCEIILGIQQTERKRFQKFLEALDTGIELAAKRIFQPWMWNDALYRLFPLYYKVKRCRDTCHTILNQIIRDERENIEKTYESQGPLDSNSKIKEETMKSILEQLIEGSGRENGYSNVELREESLMLMIAGAETSTVGVGFTLLMLAQYPEEQDKIYQELTEVFGTSERLVTSDDFPKLKYLEAFLKESLRLYSPVPVVLRKITKDVTLPSGVTLVKGCGVVLHNWAINRNPRCWGADAEQFRPSRFFEPMRHPAQFMAFGCGPRNCLGYQYAMQFMKTTFATLLRRFRVVSADAACAQKRLRLKFETVLEDVDNYTVQLKQRNVTSHHSD